MGLKLHQILAAGVLILLVLGPGGATAREQSGPDFDAIDQYVEEQMSANRLPGLALAITSGDEILYLKGYGTARNDRPMTPRTQLYIAGGSYRGSCGSSFPRRWWSGCHRW